MNTSRASCVRVYCACYNIFCFGVHFLPSVQLFFAWTKIFCPATQFRNNIIYSQSSYIHSRHLAVVFSTFRVLYFAERRKRETLNGDGRKVCHRSLPALIITSTIEITGITTTFRIPKCVCKCEEIWLTEMFEENMISLFRLYSLVLAKFLRLSRCVCVGID